MKKTFVYAIIILVATIGFSEITIAQTVPDLPQRTGSIQATQTLQFGDFTLSSGAASGGTVTVDYMGNRTASGDVILLNLGHTAQQAIFELKLCPGRRVTLSYATDIILTGNNGGSMNLKLGDTNFGGNNTSFASNKGCDDIHQITIGGALTVSSISSNPPGEYTGSFDITFIQE